MREREFARVFRERGRNKEKRGEKRKRNFQLSTFTFPLIIAPPLENQRFCAIIIVASPLGIKILKILRRLYQTQMISTTTPRSNRAKIVAHNAHGFWCIL
jgi:hypothetical protein